jgi:hypothetical protein
MVWKILSFAAIAGIALVGGWYIGSSGERAQEEKETLLLAALQDREQAIAVVNLDEGFGLDGQKQDYSSAIISALDEKYLLVPYTMAHSGISNGNYDAVITFPADFSQKVSTVNSMNPAKIVLDYDINSLLPEDLYIRAYRTVEEFQANVNATLSYMYLFSIYEEFHEAQDQAAKLLANDTADLAAANSVETYHFADVLNMGDMPQIELVMKEAEFDAYAQNVKDYAGDMSDTYLGSYKDAQDSYNGVVQTLDEQMAETIASGDQWMTAINSWDAATSEWYGLTNDDASAFNEDADEWKDETDVWHELASDRIEEFAEAFRGEYEFLFQYRWSLYCRSNRLYGYMMAVRDNEYIITLNEYESALREWQGAIDDHVTDVLNPTVVTTNEVLAINALSLDTYRTYLISAYIPALQQFFRTQSQQPEPDYINGWPSLIAPPSLIDAQLLPVTTPSLIDAEEWAEWLDNRETGRQDFDDLLLEMGIGQAPENSDPDPEDPEPANPDPEDPDMENPDHGEPELGVSLLIGDDEEFDQLTTALDSFSDMEIQAVPDAFVSTLEIARSPETVEIVFDGFTANLRTVNETAFSFDPLAFLTDAHKAKIDEIVSKYDTEIGTVKSGLESTQSENIEMITDVHQEYNTHVSDLREDVREAYDGEKNQLVESVGAFVSFKNLTSADNKSLIGDFASKMQNSRANATVNQKVVEFVAAPVTVSHADIRTIRPMTEEESRWSYIAAAACLAALALSAVMGIRGRKRREGYGR